MSFDGTRADQDVLTPATPEIWFADKCESENFIMLDGQELHLAGDFIGTLEILIPDAVCTATTFDTTDAITFYRSDGSTKKWTYA